MNSLAPIVRSGLGRLFNGGIPCSQNQATATGMVLARLLAPAGAGNPVLYGNLKREEARALVRSVGVEYTPGELLVDFVVMDRQSPTKELPLVACESEMSPAHGPGYGFSGDHGYVRDFRKLLFFSSPVLLFAAWVPGSRLDELQESLQLCASEYESVWSGRRLNIVLLPSSYYWTEEVRLGVGQGGSLSFAKLGELN